MFFAALSDFMHAQLPRRSSAGTPSGTGHGEFASLDCLCMTCREAEQRQQRSPPRAQKADEVPPLPSLRFVLKLTAELVTAFFVLQLIYKFVTRVNLSAATKAVVSDVSSSFTSSVYIVFISPFNVVSAIPGWLSRQFLVLLKDIWTVLSVSPALITIALRLAGAYALIRYLGPLMLVVFVVWPLEAIFGRPETRRAENARNPSNGAITVAMMMLLAERRRREVEGEQQQAATSAGRRGRKRRGR